MLRALFLMFMVTAAPKAQAISFHYGPIATHMEGSCMVADISEPIGSGMSNPDVAEGELKVRYHIGFGFPPPRTTSLWLAGAWMEFQNQGDKQVLEDGSTLRSATGVDATGQAWDLTVGHSGHDLTALRLCPAQADGGSQVTIP